MKIYTLKEFNSLIDAFLNEINEYKSFISEIKYFFDLLSMKLNENNTWVILNTIDTKNKNKIESNKRAKNDLSNSEYDFLIVYKSSNDFWVNINLEITEKGFSGYLKNLNKFNIPLNEYLFNKINRFNYLNSLLNVTKTTNGYFLCMTKEMSESLILETTLYMYKHVDGFNVQNINFSKFVEEIPNSGNEEIDVDYVKEFLVNSFTYPNPNYDLKTMTKSIILNKNIDINYLLSQEQKEIIKNFVIDLIQNKKILFIEGIAGSGKSTTAISLLRFLIDLQINKKYPIYFLFPSRKTYKDVFDGYNKEFENVNFFCSMDKLKEFAKKDSLPNKIIIVDEGPLLSSNDLNELIQKFTNISFFYDKNQKISTSKVGINDWNSIDLIDEIKRIESDLEFKPLFFKLTKNYRNDKFDIQTIENVLKVKNFDELISNKEFKVLNLEEINKNVENSNSEDIRFSTIRIFKKDIQQLKTTNNISVEFSDYLYESKWSCKNKEKIWVQSVFDALGRQCKKLLILIPKNKLNFKIREDIKYELISLMGRSSDEIIFLLF